MVQEPLGGHHEAGGAVAALLRVVVDECGANRVRLAVAPDLRASDLSPCASIASTVQLYILPSRITVQAPQVPRSQTLLAPVIQMIAQGVEQGDAGLDGEVDGFSVDVERDRYRARSGNLGARLRLSFLLENSGGQNAAADADALQKATA